MKKILLSLTALFLFSIAVFAQDDLLGDLQKEDSAKVKQDIAIATFKSTRIINMNSVEMTGKGNMEFMVIHHFGVIWDNTQGWSNAARLFGLNGNYASTLISFDYAPEKWLNVGALFPGNSNIQTFAKFKLLQQQTGLHNYPVSIAWYANASFNGSSTVPAPNDFTWNKFSYLNQLLIARKFTEKISAQFIGSLVHNNAIYYGYGNSHNVYSIGAGARYKIAAKKAISIEYCRQLNMYTNVTDASGISNYNPNLFSLGFDWDTGGHIFQFFITNSNNSSNYNQLTTNQIVSGLGQWSIGFNLNRSYSVKHIVKTHQ
jgi:hypothetical protein